ncbi:MAG TPA: large conductance mechanosensitive channel protein MscL [Tepidisphaeraceae bacterium]|nr:large conductance mechanosensitive channel protein MscL [Tepidisphaeraceae bacterium]
MRSLWQEFKGFAFKGNMIDLAVAVIIGAAFGGVVNSLVKDLFMPILSYIAPGKGGYEAWTIGRVRIGAFLAEVINFLIIAAAVFLLVVKVLGTLMKMRKAEIQAEPTTKECPLCLSTIPIKARRCAHCAADLPSTLPDASDTLPH